jgi:hypothetical protein
MASASTGGFNVAIGNSAGTSLTLGASNTLIGTSAGDNLTTGGSNICIGRNAVVSVTGISNELVIGSAAQFVGTTAAGSAGYFTTATAVSTGVLPATCGFIRIYLNGTFAKIPVYAN